MAWHFAKIRRQWNQRVLWLSSTFPGNTQNVMPWPQIVPESLKIYAPRPFQRTLDLSCGRSGRRDRQTAALNKGWAGQEKVELGAWRGRRVTRSTHFEMLWWGRMWHITLWKTNVMMVMSQMHVLVHSLHAHIVPPPPPWRRECVRFYVRFFWKVSTSHVWF